MNTCKCTTAGSSQVVVKDDRSLVIENPAGLVPIEEEPLIGETPIDTLQSWLTPNSLFYVRNHYPDPGMDDTPWSLTIEGCVVSEQSFVQNDFRSLPKQTLPVMLECAGNNRSDLNPRVPGNPFQNGAVSNAIWSGVPLHMVLEKAGIHPEAIEVLFEGCDEGFGEPGMEKEPYLRSLPLDVAMHPQTLLAYEMNGEPIPHEHGYPIRLIVPGWYGMASVKWLRKITLINYKYEGFFQTDRYIIEEDDGSISPVRTRSNILGTDRPAGSGSAAKEISTHIDTASSPSGSPGRHTPRPVDRSSGRRLPALR